MLGVRSMVRRCVLYREASSSLRDGRTLQLGRGVEMPLSAMAIAGGVMQHGEAAVQVMQALPILPGPRLCWQDYTLAECTLLVHA